ncbi:hypothetical protein EJ03DRAFT_324191 [Teratosphaeria nubilosa]|uniref:Uncharacterized protein n=1 Tax=Teratosphaeria nubilosa TaxID=161662 RepID=A0A6G1LKK2_9PEZI|nr:hypothetical protein EJ03DRAFT_324191 [Teratosphaeria nubilosa]
MRPTNLLTPLIPLLLTLPFTTAAKLGAGGECVVGTGNSQCCDCNGGWLLQCFPDNTSTKKGRCLSTGYHPANGGPCTC